jgi:hypothetical protein
LEHVEPVDVWNDSVLQRFERTPDSIRGIDRLERFEPSRF